MAKFSYTSKDKTGQTIKGEVQASDKKHAIDILREKGQLILRLEEAGQKGAMFSGIPASGGSQKIKMEELVIFSRQMATMTGAGITIVNSLDTLSAQIDNPALKKILQNVRDSVNTGASLSEGMGKYSKVFSEYFVNMIKAGESSGMLEDVMERVAAYLEKTSALQRKIKSAMVYPSVIIFMAVALMLVMLMKVVPVLAEMFSTFDAEMPGPTQFMINVSNTVRQYFYIYAIVVSGIAVCMKWYSRSEKGKFALDGLKLKLPIFGPLLTKVAISKFTRTLSTLVRSGVPILGALEIVAKTAGNAVVEKAVNNVRESIREGESIAAPMEKSGIFPPLVTRMIAVGEKSGELEKMLGKIADFYDDQVDTAVEGMTSLIEPLVIAFLGVVIGGIVICMFLPIFKMGTMVSM